MKNVFFISIYIVLVSCKFGVDFEVTNKSKVKIDSLIISNGYDEIQLGTINVNEVKSEFLKFTRNTPKNDGIYMIECYCAEFYKKENFGYYSNGIPSNSSFRIGIDNDTIIIKEFFQ